MTAPLTRLRPGATPRLTDGQQPLFPVLCAEGNHVPVRSREGA